MATYIYIYVYMYVHLAPPEKGVRTDLNACPVTLDELSGRYTRLEGGLRLTRDRLVGSLTTVKQSHLVSLWF